MILERTKEILKTRYKLQLEKLEISDVRMGTYLTAVRLSDNSCGVASTLTDSRRHCAKENRDYGDFTPSRISGRRVIDLLNTPKKTGIIDTLRIAVMNAVSSKIISDSTYRILEDTDPVDLIPLDSNKTITIVGGFHGYIQKISSANNKLFVLELDHNALSDEHKKFYVSAEKFREILPLSDVVIITGLALVNNTIDGLLSAVRSDALVMVTGPSSSIIPDILFENNVNIIGATRITDPDMLFTVAGEGGAGYHLFKYCASKICILNE